MRKLLKKVKYLLERGIYWILHLITLVLMTIVFFTLIPLTVLITKILRRKLLPHFDKGESTYWMEREERNVSLEQLKKQF